MLRLLRILLLVVVSFSLLSACDGDAPAAATIDGQPITDTQLEHNVRLFRFLTGLSQQPCGQPVASIGESQSAACTRFTLSNMIQQDLVAQYAAAHQITTDEDRVGDAIAQLEQNLGGPEALDERLGESGLVRDDLLVLARRLILFGQVQEAIAAGEVSDEQLRELYEGQRLSFTQLHAKHILVATRAEAERIAEQATPQNFAKLAKRYSTDPGSAQNGGDLGPLPAAQLDQVFVDAALSLAPREIGDPVQTQFGWHVIQLVSVEVQPLEEVRDQLAGPLAAEAFARWLRERSGEADVIVNPRYGRFDASTGEIVPIRSTERVPSSSPASGESAGAPPSP